VSRGQVVDLTIRRGQPTSTEVAKPRLPQSLSDHDLALLEVSHYLLMPSA